MHASKFKTSPNFATPLNAKTLKRVKGVPKWTQLLLKIQDKETICLWLSNNINYKSETEGLTWTDNKALQEKQKHCLPCQSQNPTPSKCHHMFISCRSNHNSSRSLYGLMKFTCNKTTSYRISSSITLNMTIKSEQFLKPLCAWMGTCGMMGPNIVRLKCCNSCTRIGQGPYLWWLTLDKHKGKDDA